MKIILTLVTLYFGFTISSSSGQIASKSWKQKHAIDWKPVYTSYGNDGSSTRILACQDCINHPQNQNAPRYPVFLPGKRITSAEIQNASWVEVPFWELGALDTAFLLTGSSSIRLISSERKKVEGTQIEIPLVRKNRNSWEKLNSFELMASGSELSRSENRTARIAQTETSVLQSGNWVKLGITQTGVYQIQASDLLPFGLDLVGKPSEQIKMYGSGGKMLSEANRDFNFRDIEEMAILVEDGGDGVFHSGDRIYFLGQDPNSWVLNTSNRMFEFRNHIYSDSSYYFITLSPGAGKRIQNQPTLNNPEIQTTNFLDRAVYGPDKINVISLGRIWYSDVFDFNTSKDLTFDVSGNHPDSLIRFRVGVMARSGVSYPFKLSANGIGLTPDLIPSTVSLTAQYGSYGTDLASIRTFKPSGGINSLNLNLNYQKAGNPQSLGYLNFVEVNTWKKLEWRNRNFGFRSFQFPGKVVQYSIQNLNGSVRIWDVSRPHNILNQEFSGSTFSSIQDTSVQEFFAFSPNLAPKPLFFKRVTNQNLRGLSTPDLLIITHPYFLEQAQRLADFRRSNDKLDVEVVTNEQVFNEFSSGSQDITAIRNFAMHLYYKDSGIKLKYLLLFGDCSYDYKNRIQNNTNFVPTYQSPQSLYILSTYASDDYFGILARNKGGWESNDIMDIGVGRLPAKTPLEAKVLVDKLIHYSSSRGSLGDWRNRYTFVSDNGDFCEHSRQANEMAEYLLQANPDALVKKIFLGAYERIAGAGGYTSPAATNELINTFEKGTLLVNYTGHGGETVWADEFLFSSDMIGRLNNYNNLAFVITATCDFGRHDYPNQVSGAESLLLHDKGGAIGVLTTGRPVGSNTNFAINQAFYQTLYKKIDGLPGRMGDAIREAKNTNTDRQANRGFTLLGDPSARFAFAMEDIVVTNLSENDTIKGLELVEVEGEIRKDSMLDTKFDGRVFATLFDRPGKLNLIDNDPCVNKAYPYQNSVLYSGSARVDDGRFKLRFIISRDIPFQTGPGRISLYASDENRLVDAAGSKRGLPVGGLNPNPRPDDQGPAIQAFMNDTTFVNYGLVGENADLLVFLQDDSSGIDVTGLGLGHDLIATLDGDQVFVLNDYFRNDEGSYTRGSLRFPLRGLTPGMHSIVVRAWDNANNSAETEIFFEVGIASVNGKIMKEVVLFPNPFTESIYLRMENAYAGESIHISMEIYDIIGNRIVEKEWDYANSIARPGALNELAWNGRHADGTRLPQGTYFCKIRLKSDTDGAESKINRKIVLIR